MGGCASSVVATPGWSPNDGPTLELCDVMTERQVQLVRELAYGLRGAAESLPLGRASALPGKAMRRLDLLRALR